MKSRLLAYGTCVLILGACSASYDGTDTETQGPTISVPEAVVELAAPYQDLTTARLRPDDGCYWYLHEGPVETTLIPLLTVDGRPICTAPSAGAEG